MLNFSFNIKIKDLPLQNIFKLKIFNRSTVLRYNPNSLIYRHCIIILSNIINLYSCIEISINQ